MDGLWWKTLLKWMIWGYHYFWKHPTVYNYLFSSFRCRALFLPNSSTVATHGSCFSYFEFWWTHVDPHGSAIGGFARKIKEGSTCWGWEPWERFTNGSTALSWSTWNSNTYILNCLPYLRDQTFDSTTWMFGYYMHQIVYQTLHLLPAPCNHGPIEESFSMLAFVVFSYQLRWRRRISHGGRSLECRCGTCAWCLWKGLEQGLLYSHVGSFKDHWPFSVMFKGGLLANLCKPCIFRFAKYFWHIVFMFESSLIKIDRKSSSNPMIIWGHDHDSTSLFASTLRFFCPGRGTILRWTLKRCLECLVVVPVSLRFILESFDVNLDDSEIRDFRNLGNERAPESLPQSLACR